MFRQLNNVKIFKPFSIILGIVLLLNLLLPGITLAYTSKTSIPDNFPEKHVPDLKNYEEYKIEIMNEQFIDGNYGDGNLSVDVTWGSDGTTVSWKSNLPVAYVFVKGGRGGGGTLYTYDPSANKDSALGTGTGQQISHVTFYYKEPPQEPKPGSIAGAKYNDLNGNSIWDAGEPGIKDWNIKLYRNSELVKTATTDAEGKYVFRNLAPGTYKIYEEDRTGWKQTAPKDGYFTVELLAEQNVRDKNFGNMKIPPTEEKVGSIAGAKYNDLNGNGIWNEGEPGIKDWSIKLYRDSELVKTATTDAEGKYVFRNLAPGTYKIYEEDRAGWKQTAPRTTFFTVPLSEEEQVNDLNFGNQRVPPVTPPVTPPKDDIKEGEPTAPPSKDSSPGIKITPDKVPAGDPIITLKPSEPLKAAYAILPHGKKINLHFNPKKGEWKGFFLVPFGTPDGPYLIKIYTINRQNVTRQYNYTITIDNSIPLVTINNVKKTEGVLTFNAKVLLPATNVIAKIGEYELKLIKVGDFKWTGAWKIPADLASGKYVVEVLAVDEEGNKGIASFELVINNKVALKEQLLSPDKGVSDKDNDMSDSAPIDVSFETTPRDTFNAKVASVALIPLVGLVTITYRRKKARK